MNETGESTLYCAGLPLDGERELTADERGVLERDRRLLRRRAWAFLVAPFLIYLPLLAVLATLAGDAAGDTVMIIGLVLLVAACPILILLARDAFRLARALRRGLASGRVQRFAGTLHPAVAAFDDAAARLVARRDLGPESDTEQTLDILADAMLVWQVNGKRPRRWTWAACAVVTDTPDYASTAAEWVRPWTDPDGETNWWNHRDMTGAEHKELRAHISGVGKRFLGGFLVNAYILAFFITGDWRESPWTFVPLLLFIAWADSRALANILAVFRVRRDICIGKVVIFRPGMEASGSEAEAPPGPTTEFLPFSGLLWTHDGQPAPWRKAARG